jgi:TM2 domain-containing membrane protein YozV
MQNKRKKEEDVDLVELALLEDELHKVEAKYNQEAPLSWWQKIGDRYSVWTTNRQKHSVNRKTYLLLGLFLGWCGIHRFYEKRWGLGLFYLALCWTGFPAALTIVDLIIALPMKPDENGMILI